MAKALTNGAPDGHVDFERIHDTIKRRGSEGAIEFFHGYTYSAIRGLRGGSPPSTFTERGPVRKGRALSPYFPLFSLQDIPVSPMCGLWHAHRDRRPS
jgi:beta-alanine--pyruvate transaminase